jgi:CHAT domain-containing protein/Tfp pilus assembly protein PilF
MDALSKQEVALAKAGKFAEALPLAQQLLDMREKRLGPEHIKVADSLGDIGICYLQLSQPEQAIPALQRALALRDKLLGPLHDDTIGTLQLLAVAYDGLNDVTHAAPIEQRLLTSLEKTRGKDSAAYLEQLEDLGHLYLRVGQAAPAQPLFEQLYAARQRLSGPRHADTLTAAEMLADCQQMLGNYEASEKLYRGVVEARRSAPGPDDESTLRVESSLAAALGAQGKDGAARPLLEHVYQSSVKKNGPNDMLTALAGCNLALLALQQGDYGRAYALLEPATRLATASPEPPPSESLATLQLNVGLLDLRINDLGKAEPLLQSALRNFELALGPEHPSTATAMADLAALYFRQGGYSQAQPLYEKALQIRRRVLGDDHPDTASSLQDLAKFYIQGAWYATTPEVRNKYFEQAAALLTQAQQHLRHADDAVRADVIADLALVRMQQGQGALAEPMFRQAIALYEKRFGRTHAALRMPLRNLCLLQLERGQREAARQSAHRLYDIEQQSLANVLSFGSERQRMRFLRTTDPYSLLATLGDAPALATAVLQRKAIVLDSLLEDRRYVERAGDAAARDKLRHLNELKERLSSATYAHLKVHGADSPERKQQIDALRQQIEGYQRDIARIASAGHGPLTALHVTPQQVQSVLPRDAALIEFLHYRDVSKPGLVSHYGAVILGPSGPPRWVPLGDEREVARLVAAYQHAMRSTGGSRKRLLANCTKVLNDLYATVWAPIEKHLPAQASQVFLSPEGQLHQVSFATLLMPDGKFLIERHLLRYVTSGRDLLASAPPKAATGPAEDVFFGNPDYNAALSGAPDPGLALAMRGATGDSAGPLTFVPLPGTQSEVDSLSKFCASKGDRVTVFTQQQATKERLEQVRSPHLLHLATHGFFMPPHDRWSDILTDNDIMASGGRGVSLARLIEDPLMLSGMALAGAQTTVKAMVAGLPVGDNNGLLTVADVAGLQLQGTWLVTLSACETGLGSTSVGNAGSGTYGGKGEANIDVSDDVIGLRRGFALAGTQHLLMSLWPIADAETVEFMQQFYATAQKDDAPLALAKTQRALLMRYRTERDLVDACNLAGPFIMTSQGLH